MRHYPGLVQRGTRWYIRRAVPTDLVEFLTRKERAIRDAKAESLSIRQIADRCGVSVGTVHNVLKG